MVPRRLNGAFRLRGNRKRHGGAVVPVNLKADRQASTITFDGNLRSGGRPIPISALRRRGGEGVTPLLSLLGGSSRRQRAAANAASTPGT